MLFLLLFFFGTLHIQNLILLDFVQHVVDLLAGRVAYEFPGSDLEVFYTQWHVRFL